MNHFKTSDGNRITKRQIDLNVRKAKFKKLNSFLDEHDFIFCEKCKKSNSAPYDCAHTISVNECQNSGRSELAWDIGNIQILCRSCHKKHDSNLILKG